MKTQNFKQRVKGGIQSLTPLQLARAKRVGMWWQVGGMLCAMGFIAWQGPRYWLFFLSGVLFVLALELVQVQQQVRNFEKIAMMTSGGGR